MKQSAAGEGEGLGESDSADPPAVLDSESVERWLSVELSARLGIPVEEIDWDVPLADYGLDSAEAVSLAYDLEVLLGQPLPPTFFYDHPTIARAASHLEDLTGGEATFSEGASSGA